MKYAITLSSFKGHESIDQTLAKLSGIGFDALEMYGEPRDVDSRKLAELFHSYGFTICGVTGMWGLKGNNASKRKLLSSDMAMREHAKEYVKECVKLCHCLGGTCFNICLFSDDDNSIFERTHKFISSEGKEKARGIVVPIMSDLAKFARDHDVTLVLEPLNRYSTPYCCTAHDALAIADDVDNGNLGIMLDTFHMNIEEDSFDEAIRASKKMLHHMHFADNNRKIPGQAHIDFSAIVNALSSIGYQGYISFEPTIRDNNYEAAIGTGLKLIRQLEQETKGKK